MKDSIHIYQFSNPADDYFNPCDEQEEEPRVNILAIMDEVENLHNPNK